MKTLLVCRCCLSEDCYKDISNEYFIGGRREIYADLLLSTFNIDISYQEDSSRLICEECVVKIREAATFRAQVEQAEDAFRKKNIGCGVSSGIDLTKLIDYEDDFIDHITGEFEFDDDYDERSDDHFNDPDDGWDNGVDDYIVKLEPAEKSETNVDVKQKAKLVKGKTAKGGKAKGNSKQNKNDTEKESPRKRIKTVSQINHKENSLKIINNSNICLFESLKTKFRCFYCKNSYLNITELREHTAVHANPGYLRMCINRLQGMSFKNVDISNLSCKNCSEKLNDLDELKRHLTEKHNVEFNGDNHMLIPYKLEEGYNCVLCDQKFNTFFRLSIHMNSHYTNNVCEICGVSYINRLSLRMHVSSMHKEKKCSVCSQTFSNTYSRVKHMRKVHNSSEAKRYCLLCNKTFRYTYMLDEHKIQEHGMKRQISVCQECGKTFLTPVNLKTHIRAVHIRERNHPCSLCGMSFFTSCDQRRHERTHQDVRLFACNFCEGRFKSKDSLRRHLKRQHGQHHFLTNSQQNRT